MIKAIFFDIDGTLVSFNSHTVPQSTKNALSKLRENGVKLFLATGRSPMWLPAIKDLVEFEFDGYVMVNGQYCIVGDEVIHKMRIDENDIEKVIPYMEDQKISCEFVEYDHMYINFVNKRVEELRALLGSTAPTSKPEDLRRVKENDTYQLCAYIKDEEEEEFFKHLPNCRAVRWNPLFADIIPFNGGKSVGIKKVLEHINIDQEESMAFGDGGNDIEMLEFAKIGVAMGNAGDDVKESADFVTLDVDNHGIEHALKKYNIL
ncbi:Cof-type HAD-IIB family hydrolase [Peptostreptococcus faecalis]|uniref:Cof-type HAD-IIB family hydrolase n=1 Tax=Peptostreptococcus faecalis TaxID=2045015 RepID=UPI000C7C8C8A|nr:Cof-type HAD-IIB family hydrolase [Peptostreptococcus faecalis]